MTPSSRRIRRAPQPEPPMPRAGPVEPAHDDDAERALLGAMLTDTAAVITALDLVAGADLYRPHHAAIFDATVAAFKDGHGADPILVGARLAASGELARIPEAAAYLFTCITACPNPSHAGHYARIVLEHARGRRLVESGIRLAQIATVPDGERRGQLLAALLADLGEVSRPPGTVMGTVPAGMPTALDWHDLWAQATTEVRWEIAPLAERGHSIAIFSEPKTGKSLLALEMSCALATGRRVLANPAREPRRVVYVDYENTQADLHDRLTALGYRPDELANLVYLSFPAFAPLDTASGGRALVETVQFYGGEVLIIDTASRVVEGAENDADTWNALYRHSLIPLKGAGVTIIRLDHTGKDPTRGQRGSSAKDGDVDAVWRLVARTPTSLYLKRERTRTGRGDGLVELVRRFEPLRHELPAVTETSVSVLSVIAQLDALGLPPDINRERAREALNRAGIKVRNDVLGPALREWKERISPIRTAGTILESEDLFSGRPGDGDDLGDEDMSGDHQGMKVQVGAHEGPVPGSWGHGRDGGVTPRPVMIVPGTVPPYGGPGTDGTAGPGPQDRPLTSCAVCYGPLDDIDGIGRHPSCRPVGGGAP